MTTADELRAAAAAIFGPEDTGDGQPDTITVTAEPLAGLLDAAADLIDAHPALRHGYIDGEPCGDLACQVVTHAGTIARQIRGAG